VIAGRAYENNFCAGFRAQNCDGEDEEKEVFRHRSLKVFPMVDGSSDRKNILSDIDACYEVKEDCALAEILPRGANTSGVHGIKLRKGTNVFFEVTTSQGKNLVKLGAKGQR
jgi:hypothetical protein